MVSGVFAGMQNTNNKKQFEDKVVITQEHYFGPDCPSCVKATQCWEVQRFGRYSPHGPFQKIIFKSVYPVSDEAEWKAMV